MMRSPCTDRRYNCYLKKQVGTNYVFKNVSPNIYLRTESFRIVHIK
jgi:hypothetical protein